MAEQPTDCRCSARAAALSRPRPPRERNRRPASERPPARQRYIRIHELRPWLDERGWWDGVTAVKRDGEKVWLSYALRTEMGLMLAEGYWLEGGA